MRVDGRRPNQLRNIDLLPGYQDYPEGSLLMKLGATRVLCSVTIEPGTPRWMQQQSRPGGWITAEYAMLPRATLQRTARETNGLSGRSQEIRRLVGRSLRAAFNLEQLGPRTFIVDCDVLQADGGTRTASITAGYLALALALKPLLASGEIPHSALHSPVAAVSVGLLDGQPLLDLCYQEDSVAQADMNVVMNARGELIEVQCTAEGAPFSRRLFDQLLELAGDGIRQLIQIQQQILEA
jgi:ribonuclease PH